MPGRARATKVKEITTLSLKIKIKNDFTKEIKERVENNDKRTSC